MTPDKPVNIGRPMFQSRRHPFGLTGALVALALLGFFAWRFGDAITVAFDGVRSGGSSIREGGPGFPATIRIGERSLEITNSSREPWSCEVSVGQDARHRAGITVLPGTPGELPYRVFLARQASGSDQTLRNLARDVIRMECVERRGRRYSQSFE